MTMVPGSRARRMHLKPFTVACSAAFVVAAGGALAQESQSGASAAAAGDSSTLETVVVSGLRSSLEKSLEIKRSSDLLMETVTAEDIGKLPDVSIADSLSRLPGLTAQRVNGHAQVINMRGMSPDFVGTTLNGREQTSTGQNRGVEFDQYPSELISQADAIKTPDATTFGQGVAGTVNLHTVRPLDISSMKMAVNVRGERNSLGDLNNGYGGTSANGNRVSFSYINQFDDRKIGLALGYAHLDQPEQEQHYKAWWWGAPGSSYLNGATGIGGQEAADYSRDVKRDGAVAVLEFKPNKDFHSTLDLYYSTLNETEVMRGLMWDSNPWSGYTITNPGFQTSGGVVVANSGTIGFPASGSQPIVRNDYNTRKDKLSSIGWNTEAKLGGFTAIADLSYSSAHRDESLFETYAGVAHGTSTDPITYNISLYPQFASLSTAQNFADPASILLGDQQGWGRDGRLQNAVQDDKMKTINLHAKHDLGGIFSQVDAGVNLSMRDKTRTFDVWFANLNGGAVNQAVSSSYLLAPASLYFVGIPNVLSYDVNAVSSAYYTLTKNMSGGPGGDYSKDFGVHERVQTYYAKADIETQVGRMPVRGNVGAQFIHTNQWSNAYAFNQASNATPIGNVESGINYNDFLPSLNLVGELSRDSLIRFGLAKTETRPRIDDMNAAEQAGVDPTTHLWSGSGGNPRLLPWRARSLDLAFEHYMGKRSYVAAGAFVKKLDTYIYTQSIAYDFTGFVNPTPSIVPRGTTGTYSTSANGSGGLMKGFEFATALDGGLISPGLDGYGVVLGYGVTGSSIQELGPTGTAMWQTLPGLSTHVVNVTLYYERDGITARLSDRYRSDFRGEYQSLFGNTSVLRTLAQSQFDTQLGYEFQSGTFKNLGVLFQVLNITNSEDRNVQDGTGFGGAIAPQETNRFGRAFLFGLNYKL